MSVDLKPLKPIVEKYKNKKGVLIPLLQEVQNLYKYVPEDAVHYISDTLSIFPVEIYGVLTFYSQFYLKPRGENIIKVCMGTACYIMGGKEILDHLINKLEINVDETTTDKVFTLERVACLGCCGMGPVVMINEDFHGNCTLSKMDQLLDEYRGGGKK